MRAIALALRHRDLRLMLSAELVSLTGDWALEVGLAYCVYTLTSSTLASALMLIASFAPQIVLGSLAGVLVDRWDPRRTMVVADALLAVGLLPLLAVHRPGQVWIVYAVAAWAGCAHPFFTASARCILPRIVDDRQLLTANALNGQNAVLSRLAGAAIGCAGAPAPGVGFNRICAATISAGPPRPVLAVTLRVTPQYRT